MSARARLVTTLVAATIAPLAAFGLVLLATGALRTDPNLGPLLVFVGAVAAVVAILVGAPLEAQLQRPLKAMAGVIDRVSAGDLGARIDLAGDDEIARLAESHNRLAADLERRNRELTAILAAVERAHPSRGTPALADQAARDARDAFGLLDAEITLVGPDHDALLLAAPARDWVPGEPRPVRAELRDGTDLLGILVGRVPATRRWEQGDQDLLDLFGLELGVALRNAELFGRVEAQNARLRALDAAKDEFLRGVSHNLQTPLARITANADQLAAERPDRRLEIIAEQSGRLSRMVRQLLTVSRLESGALRPTADVLALAPRVRRAWEALAPEGIEMRLTDRSAGWLAIADPDQLDQVLWALLDNAIRYGGGTPIEVTLAVEEGTGEAAGGEGGESASGKGEAPSCRMRLTIADHGPGVSPADRGRLFGRFERGSSGADSADGGSGLGLYVSRELCRAMGGDLVLEAVEGGDAASADGPSGAAFSVRLLAERADE